MGAKRSLRQNSHAFTLIEVMVVLVIFSIAALGTTALTVHTIRTNGANKLRVKATSVIQDKIENLRLDLKAGKTIASGEDTLEGMTRSWQVYTNQPSVGLTTVIVEVKFAQAPLTDARFLRYASILGTD